MPTRDLVDISTPGEFERPAWRRLESGPLVMDLDEGQIRIEFCRLLGKFDADYCAPIEQAGVTKWTHIGTFGTERAATDAVCNWVSWEGWLSRPDTIIHHGARK